MRFTDIVLTSDGGGFKGQDGDNRFSAEFPRFLIHEAWARGADFEALADGFGVGNGTHGDWSAIRDSTPEAINAMFEVALNILFGAKCDCGFASTYKGNRHTPECGMRGHGRAILAAVNDELGA